MRYPLCYAVGLKFQKGKKNQCGELIALSYLVYYFKAGFYFVPFVSTYVIKLPNIYRAFTATLILETKEQRINRIQEQDQATWFQSGRLRPA